MKLSALFSPDKLKLWLLVMLAGLLTLASYWVLEITRKDDKAEAKPVRTRPDYYVDNFNFIKMQPNGQNKYRVVGTKFVHYPNDDHADVTLPVMTNLDPDTPLTTARAETGVVKNMSNQTENELHLHDKVIVNRPQSEKASHLQLNTDYLLIFPDKNTMQTDLPIEIINGNTVTTGVGLFGNNDTQEWQIFHNVHSIIPPRDTHKR